MIATGNTQTHHLHLWLEILKLYTHIHGGLQLINLYNKHVTLLFSLVNYLYFSIFL